MKNEPLKNKGGQIIELVDAFIVMVRKNTAKLQEAGLPVYLDESEIENKREIALKEFKDKKMFEADEIKSAVEWFKIQMNYLNKVHKYPAKDVYRYMCRKVDEAFSDLYPLRRRA